MLPFHTTPAREAQVLFLEGETRTRTSEKTSLTHSEVDASPAPFTWGSESTSISPLPAPGANHYPSCSTHKTFARSVAPRVSGTNHSAQKSNTAYTPASGVRLLRTSATEFLPPNAPPSPVRSIIDFYLGSSPPPRRPTQCVPSDRIEGEQAERKVSADSRPALLSSSSSSQSLELIRRSPAPARGYIEDFLALTDEDEVGELPQVEAAPPMCDSGGAVLGSTSPPTRAVGVALDNSSVTPEMWDETSSSAATSFTAVSDGFENAEDAQRRRRSQSVARMHLGSSSSNSPLLAQLTASPMNWRRSVDGTSPLQGDDDHAPQRAATMTKEKHAASWMVGTEAPSSATRLVKKVRIARDRSRRPLSSSSGDDQCEAVERVLRFPFCTAQEDTADIQSVHTKNKDEKGTQRAPISLHVAPVASDVLLDDCSPRRQAPQSPFMAPPSVSMEKCVMKTPFTGSQENGWRGPQYVSVGRGQLTVSQATGASPESPALFEVYTVPAEMSSAVTQSLVAEQGNAAQTAPRHSMDDYTPSFPMGRWFVEPSLRRRVEIPVAVSERYQSPRSSAKKRNAGALLARLYPGPSSSRRTGATSHISSHDKRCATQLPQRTTDPPPPRWSVSTKMHYNPVTGGAELANADREHSALRYGSRSRNSEDCIKERLRSSHRRRSASAPAKVPLHTRTSLLRLEATTTRKAAEAALREEIESPSFHPTVAPHSARICRDKLRELKRSQVSDASPAAVDAAAGPQGFQREQASRTANFQCGPKPRQGISREEIAFWGDAAAVADVSVSSSDGADARATSPSGSSRTIPAAAQSSLPQGAASVGTSFHVGALSHRNGVELRACQQARQQQGVQERRREEQPQMKTGRCCGASSHPKRQSTKEIGCLEEPYPRSPASKDHIDTWTQCDLLPSESTAVGAEDTQGFSGSTMATQTELQRVDLYSTAPTGAPETRETWLERQQRVEDRLLELEADRQRRLAMLRRVTGKRDLVTGQPLFKPFTGR